ncbi:hypothetical protein GEMRC1_007364 [Eukaryota sp. GEM-RC1]
MNYFFLGLLLFSIAASASDRVILRQHRTSIDLGPGSLRELSFGLEAVGMASVRCDFDGKSDNMTITMTHRDDTRFWWHTCSSLPHQNSFGYFSTSFLPVVTVHIWYLIVQSFLFVVFFGSWTLISSKMYFIAPHTYILKIFFFKLLLDCGAQVYLHTANLTGNHYGFFVFYTSLSCAILCAGLASFSLGKYWEHSDYKKTRVMQTEPFAMNVIFLVILVVSFFLALFHLLFNIFITTLLFSLLFILVAVTVFKATNLAPSMSEEMALGVESLSTTDKRISRFQGVVGFVLIVYCVVTLIYSLVRIFLYPSVEPGTTYFLFYTWQMLVCAVFTMLYSSPLYTCFQKPTPQPENSGKDQVVMESHIAVPIEG